jgi:hypothetical protein
MRTAIPLTVLVTGIACSLFTAPAQARARVFVASYGNDSNPCTFGSPCKTFAQAVGVVDVGGEVTAIDSAGFGPIFISKSVSITSPNGVEAGVLVPPSGIGIVIAADQNAVINLRGLTIDGAGTGNVGIEFASGKILSVESCFVRNLTNGLNAGNNGAGSLTLTVSNSYFNDNVANGILLQPNGEGAIFASVDRTVMSGNGFAGLNLIGQFGTNRVQATVTDSVAANNNTPNGTIGTGFLVQSTQGQAVAFLTVTHSSASGNAIGISAFGNFAELIVGQTTVSDNITAWSAASGGSIYSYGDNNINGGGTIGPLLPTPKS